MNHEQQNLAVVQQDGCAIQFIKNPSEAVQLAAIYRNADAIKYIKNPSISIQMMAKFMS